jgi:hypothetical protein
MLESLPAVYFLDIRFYLDTKKRLILMLKKMLSS